jgi:DNA primase catalytic core
MDNTTDLLNFEIYPALYANLATALPEFGFKQTRGGYISTTEQKITGDRGKRGKVYVYANNITHLIDYTRGSVSIWDYIQKRDSLSNGETLKKLAELAGVILPPLDKDTQDRIKKAVTEAQVWEDANQYFIYCLNNSDSKTAQEVKGYLQGRGYNDKDIEAMELGYIPSQDKLYKYLTETKKHSTETVKETIQLHKDIGNTHVLTIPYREPVGRIKGIIARAIKPDTEPKYLYSTGLKRDEFLFNLRAQKTDKDLIIVEGLLDSLIATARGMDNVVALGGTSLNKKQVETAIRYGAKMFTLCLDNDKAGVEATLRALELLQGRERVYIAQLPDYIKDPDELIKQEGIFAFRGAIATALPYWKYRIKELYERYTALEDTQGYLTEKQKDELLTETVRHSQTINSPVDRDQYVKYLTSMDWVRALGITTESLQDTVETLRYKADVEKQGRELKKLQEQAKELLDKGNTAGAIDRLETGLKNIKIQKAKDLLPVYSFTDWEKEITTTPQGLKTGIRKLDKEITIPQGAITLIAGRPSHGKTTLLFNLLLSITEKYGDSKRFYFFTYEEPKKLILVKILNRLIDTDLREADDRYSVNTNLEYLKYYLRDHQRKDRAEVEHGRRLLQSLMDSRKITVVDRSYSVEELGAVIRYLHKTEPDTTGAIFIDYIQRMSTEKKTQDKRTEIAHISDQILQTAKDTGLPIILGAQLNRGAGDSPALENLKEAGNLEEDANLVLSVYNESREKETKEDGEGYGRVVELEIKTLKNRDGEPNKREILSFDRWTLKIADPETSRTPF